MRPNACLAAGILYAAAAPYAHATIYHERADFVASFPSLPGFEDFEGAGDIQRDFGDFFLQSGAGGGEGVGTFESGFPSRVAVQFFADDYIEINFRVPVEAVGFQVGCFDFFDAGIPLDVQITLFAPDDSMLDMLVIPTNGRAMTTFIGFADYGEIAHVRVGDLPLDAGLSAIDDVTYGVPAPSAAAAFFACVWAGLRRRR